MKTLETMATIDNAQRLVLDQPLPLADASRVRVIVLMPEEAEEVENSEIDEQSWLRAAAASPSFAFLAEPEEDIYTLQDGRPFRDEEQT